MRLEKIYTHHLIRALRFVIPVIVVALIAVPVWNYWDRPAEDPVFEEPLPRLVENMSALTEGFKLSRTDGERISFTIEARTNLGFTDGRNLLQDVTVTIFGEAGDPERRIQSDECGYDAETDDIRFEGNVELHLDENTVGRTAELIYNHRARTIESRQPVLVTRPGQFEGRADSLRFLIPDSMVVLDGSVKITLEDGSTLQTASARFHQRDGWAQVSGGVEILSAGGRLLGEEASAELVDATFRPSALTVSGKVHAESFDPGRDWILDAAALHMTLSPEGAAQSMSARGTAALHSGEENDPQSLFGDRIDGFFDGAGRIGALEATGSARMVFGPEEELRSARIRNQFSGAFGLDVGNAVSTSEDSSLRLGDARLRGRDFEIERSGLVRFRTDRRATLETASGRSTGDRTTAAFDPEGGGLIELVQTGDIRFDQGGRRGTAGRAEVSSAGDRIVLQGRPVVSDERFRVEADTITLDQTKQFFTAVGDARTVSLDPADPTLIVGGKAEGDGEKIVYSDTAELWRERIHVRAQAIEIFPRERRFIAVGEIDSTVEELRARSDRLEFADPTGVVHYVGNVRVRSDDMTLSADDLEATLEGGEPRRIVAKEDVIITGRGFGVKADEAIYSEAAQTITLYGREAEVSDSTTAVQGRKLVMNIEDNGVVVNGEDGSRVVSRRLVGPR